MTDTIMKASRVAAVSEVVRQTGDGAIYESLCGWTPATEAQLGHSGLTPVDTFRFATREISKHEDDTDSDE